MEQREARHAEGAVELNRHVRQLEAASAVQVRAGFHVGHRPADAAVGFLHIADELERGLLTFEPNKGGRASGQGQRKIG